MRWVKGEYTAVVLSEKQGMHELGGDLRRVEGCAGCSQGHGEGRGMRWVQPRARGAGAERGPAQ